MALQPTSQGVTLQSARPQSSERCSKKGRHAHGQAAGGAGVAAVAWHCSRHREVGLHDQRPCSKKRAQLKNKNCMGWYGVKGMGKR